MIHIFNIAIILALFCPSLLRACAACGFQDDGTQGAFLLTAGLLTFAPLLMFGGLVWLIRKKFLKQEGSSESEINS